MNSNSSTKPTNLAYYNDKDNTNVRTDNLTARHLHSLNLHHNVFKPELQCARETDDVHNKRILGDSIVKPALFCDPYDISKSNNVSYGKPITPYNQLDLYEKDVDNILYGNKKQTNRMLNVSKDSYNNKYDDQPETEFKLGQVTKLNEFNINKLRDNNIAKDIINTQQYEYSIYITSADRDIQKYPNPFSYQVKFNPISNTNDAYIPIRFDNIKRIKLYTCILPRRFHMAQKNYSLYIDDSETIINNILTTLPNNHLYLYYNKSYISFTLSNNSAITYNVFYYDVWNINVSPNDNFKIITDEIFITPASFNNSPTYVKLPNINIKRELYNYFANNTTTNINITSVEPTILHNNLFATIDNLTINEITISYIENQINYQLIYKKYTNSVSQQFVNYVITFDNNPNNITNNIISTFDNAVISFYSGYITNFNGRQFTLSSINQIISYQYKFCPAAKGFTDLIDECFVISLDQNKNILTSDNLPLLSYYKIDNDTLDAFPYLFFNVKEMEDIYDYSTNNKIRNTSSILYPDYVNSDYLYINTNLNETIYKISKLAVLNNLSINFQDYEGNQLTTYDFFDLDSFTPGDCICKTNSKTGDHTRNYLCSHSYFRHPLYEKFQNRLIFKISRVEIEQAIEPFT